MFSNQNRETMREVFFRAWRNHRNGQALEGVERVLVDVALNHPEYHALLDNPGQHLDRDYSPALGQTNPFLHMGLHVAIQEQLMLDEPRGIRDIYKTLRSRDPDEHALQHHIMDCLGECLWQAQSQGKGLDPATYLDCLTRLANTRR